MRRNRREAWLQYCPLSFDQTCCMHPPIECYAVQAFSIASNFDPKNKGLKNKIRSRWEKFAPSYNPFFRIIQITILATAKITRNTTRFSLWNCGKTLSTTSPTSSSTSCFGSCGPSSLRRDSKTDKFARSSRRRAQTFLLSHCHSEDNRACLPGSSCNSSCKGATRSVQAARWARTRCSRSSNLAHNSNASELSPLTSRADSRNPYTAPFETEKRHWTQEGCRGPYGIREQTVLRPSAYVDLQPEALTLRRGKTSLAFRLHTVSFDKDWPK